MATRMTRAAPVYGDRSKSARSRNRSPIGGRVGSVFADASWVAGWMWPAYVCENVMRMAWVTCPLATSS